MRKILSKSLVGYFMLCGVYGLSADNWSLQSAEEAYTSGDFQTAVAHWRGLAELGDVVAMNNPTKLLWGICNLVMSASLFVSR